MASSTAGDVITANKALQRVVDRGHALDLTGIAAEQRAMIQQLTYGVLRQWWFLESIVAGLVSKPLRRKDIDVKLQLMLGLYRLHFMRTPDHAAVNETVAGLPLLRKNWARGLVNGTLRAYLRDRNRFDALADDEAHFNHPRWLIEALRAAWPEHAAAVLAANQSQAPVTLRHNPQRVGRADFISALVSAEVEHREQPGSGAIVLSGSVSVPDLPGYDDGWFSVQDEASQYVAGLLDVPSGTPVLDACAAPGGKSAHLLEQGSAVVAMDIDPARAAVIETNWQRLRLEGGRVVVADFLDPLPADLPSGWDRILLDAPCSATGVIRRHPDIKLLRRQEDIAKLAATQRAMLRRAWALLNPGGILVYTTCSVLPQENEHIVHAFVAETFDAKTLPVDLPPGFAVSEGRQLLPVEGGHDGFYYARLMKVV